MSTLRDLAHFAAIMLMAWVALAVCVVTGPPIAAYRWWHRRTLVRAYTVPALRRARRRGW